MTNQKYVNMSNQLIKAAHGLNLMEKRVLMLVISKIDSKDIINGGAIVFTANEFMNEYDTSKKNTYTELKKTCKNLHLRTVTFLTDKSEKCINWIITSEYIEAAGTVSITLHPEINPHVYDLKAHFTSYKLSRASSFKSVYAWRLFEVLMQFKQVGKVSIEIDELAKRLEFPANYLSDFAIIRRKVIEPVLVEIKECASLPVAYTTKKSGRKTTGIEFTFDPKQASQNIGPQAKQKAKVYRYGVHKIKNAENSALKPLNAVDKSNLHADFLNDKRLAEMAGLELKALAGSKYERYVQAGFVNS